MTMYMGVKIGTITKAQGRTYMWTMAGWTMQAPPLTVSEDQHPAAEETQVTPEWKASLLIGEGLGVDTGTRSELCPKCGGGATKEKAFSISKDTKGYLYWRCFRSSCGYKGSTGGGTKGPRARSREPKILSADLVALVEDQTDYFSDEYGVDQIADEILWCPEREAFAFPIKASSGGTIGHQLRWYDGRKPKSESYPGARNVPFIAHYPNNAQHGVVVVEDPLSALKVRSAGVYAVALLGTNMDFERAYEIRVLSGSLVMALDKGTLPLALSYRDKFSSVFDKITIWSLDKDLKYVTRERIIRAIIKGDTDFITSR